LLIGIFFVFFKVFDNRVYLAEATGSRPFNFGKINFIFS
jgi:hypothetical protein